MPKPIPEPAPVALSAAPQTTIDSISGQVVIHIHVPTADTFGSADRTTLQSINALLQALTGQETTDMNTLAQIVQQLKDTSTKLAAEGTKVDGLEQNILTLENGQAAQIAAQQQQVTTLQQANAGQQTQIDTLNATIATLQANGVDTTDLQTVADALATSVTTIAATHDKMQADLVANTPATV